MVGTSPLWSTLSQAGQTVSGKEHTYYNTCPAGQVCDVDRNLVVPEGPPALVECF